MICPTCGKATRVIATRDDVGTPPRRRRRRECEDGHRHSTIELPVGTFATSNDRDFRAALRLCRMGLQAAEDLVTNANPPAPGREKRSHES